MSNIFPLQHFCIFTEGVYNEGVTLLFNVKVITSALEKAIAQWWSRKPVTVHISMTCYHLLLSQMKTISKCGRVGSAEISYLICVFYMYSLLAHKTTRFVQWQIMPYRWIVMSYFRYLMYIISKLQLSTQVFQNLSASFHCQFVWGWFIQILLHVWRPTFMICPWNECIARQSVIVCGTSFHSNSFASLVKGFLYSHA